MADYLIHFNPYHDPKTGRFDFALGARVNGLGEVVDRKGNVNTDYNKYMVRNYKQYKNHPGGFTKVGRNRNRIVSNKAADAVKKAVEYDAAKIMNKKDPSIISNKKLLEFKERYENSINFIKKYINDDVKITFGVNEDGIEYLGLRFIDPLTNKTIFSQSSTSGVWNIYPDGKINFNAGKTTNSLDALNKMAIEEGFSSWDNVPEDHWLKRD